MPAPLRFLARLLGAALLPGLLLPLQAQPVVFVANQGNFSDGNGSVSRWAQTDVVPDFVELTGSILQSVRPVGTRLYAMANTGDRIDIFDTATGAQVGQIPGVVSPRYMVVGEAGVGYVTNLYAGGFTGGSVTVLDLAGEFVRTTIAVGDNPEGLVYHDGRLYVANNGFGEGTTISVIDAQTEAVVDTLALGCDGPRFVFVDEQAELLAFCTGKTVWNDTFTEIVEETTGQIVFWNLAADTASARIVLPRQLGAAGPGQDADYVPARQEAYAVMDGRILRIDTARNAVADTLEAPGDDLIGAVAYDGWSDRILLGRVPVVDGFTVNGSVTMLDRDGSEVGAWEAGIAPAYLSFFDPVAVANEAGPAPDPFRLDASYPNPFRRSTTFTFSIDVPARTTLRVYTLAGRPVATLVDGLLPAGRHSRAWTPDGLASGVYVARLETGGLSRSRTLTLLR